MRRGSRLEQPEPRQTEIAQTGRHEDHAEQQQRREIEGRTLMDGHHQLTGDQRGEGDRLEPDEHHEQAVAAFSRPREERIEADESQGDPDRQFERLYEPEDTRTAAVPVARQIAETSNGHNVLDPNESQRGKAQQQEQRYDAQDARTRARWRDAKESRQSVHHEDDAARDADPEQEHELLIPSSTPTRPGRP